MVNTRGLVRALVCAAAVLCAACDNAHEPLPDAPRLSADLIRADATAPRATPPRNAFLADGYYPTPHGDPAQSDSTDFGGPLGQTRVLKADELRFTYLGPGSFGAFTSSRYPDGRRVLWVSATNGLFKLDEASYEILAQRPTEFAKKYTQEWADGVTAKLDQDNGVGGLRTIAEALRPLGDLSSVYILVGSNNWVYIAAKDGSITAYGDAAENDPASEIVVKARFQLPPELAGAMVGMNMTYDGWIVVATENGWLITISRDLTTHRAVRLRHAESEDTSAKGPGNGWVRNSMAIDDMGGIYIASRNHMHKVVWTGDQLSTDEARGAWSEPYRNGGGGGTGATPTLMGFGGEDRLIALTDGDALMNLTLFWRDAIPEGWTQLPEAPSRRIAGQAPATMGNPALRAAQSEQSVVVSGFGVVVVNNTPRNKPFFLPEARAMGALSGGLGSNPKFQPFGVHKFVWDLGSRRLYSAWANSKVSSPNGVPWMSRGSNQVYFIGARENRWTLEALDWTSGESTFHWTIGGQAWNSTFSGVVLDESGRVTYGAMWGRVRIEPK